MHSPYKLDKPYLRTATRATVYHLQKFLYRRFGLPSPQDIEVLCRGEVLTPNLTLEHVSRTKWPSAKSPMFQFRVRSSTTSTNSANHSETHESTETQNTAETENATADAHEQGDELEGPKDIANDTEQAKDDDEQTQEHEDAMQGTTTSDHALVNGTHQE